MVRSLGGVSSRRNLHYAVLQKKSGKAAVCVMTVLLAGGRLADRRHECRELVECERNKENEKIIGCRI